MAKTIRGREMRIAEVECIPVTMPIEAPILTSYGSLHSYARSIIRLTTEDGSVGYGEVSARVGPAQVATMKPLLVGLSVWETTLVTRRIKNWNYYPWTKVEPIMAAMEMACLDIQGKALDLPVYKLLGGKVRDTVPVAGYVFFRHANADGAGQVHSTEEVLSHARGLVKKFGFTSLKLKGGYFRPEHDRDVLTAMREEFGPDLGLRIDPQGSWTVATAIRIGQQIEKLHLDYLEDPVWGAANMAQVRKAVQIPLATNMCVTEFDQLYPAFRMGAVDVILSDVWYWGGMKACLGLERVCGTIGLDIGMHSSSELAIGWAAMLHTAAATPNMLLSADFMNMHLTEDISVEDRLLPEDGHVAPPERPGLGITIDEEKLAKYARIASERTAEDRFLNPAMADAARPGWFPEIPAW